MDRSEISESSSAFSESFSDRRRAGDRAMSSVAIARSETERLAVLLAPVGAGWKEQVTAIHRALTDERHFPGALKDLSWNRVKSWLYGEARRVDYEEVLALQELRALEEASREHREFIASTNRLAVVLAREGASLTRAQMAALERIAGRSAGAQGAGDARSGMALRPMAVSRDGGAAR